MLSFVVYLVFVPILLTCCKTHEYNAKGWSLASDYLRLSMNTSIDPCDDFYGFVCGQYVTNYSTTGIYSEFSRINAELAKKYIGVIENVNLNDVETKSYAKSLKIFYQQCRNINRSTTDYQPFFRDMYANLQQYFLPIVNVENAKNDGIRSENKTFWQLVGTMQRELGLSFLFEAEVMPGEVDCGTKPVLHLRPIEIQGFSYLYFNFDDLKLFMQNIVVAYHNISLDENDINDTVNSAINFQKDFRTYILETTRGSYEYYQMRNQHRFTYSDLQKQFPGINWQAYFDGLLPASIKSKWISRNSFIMIDGMNFFSNLSSFIKKQDALTLSNFGYLLIMQKYANFFSKTYRRRLDRSSMLEYGVFKDECLDLSIRYFSTASFRLLFDDSLKIEEWRNDMNLLKDMIYSSLIFMIYNTKWMNAKDKSILVDRVKMVDFYGDIPNWISDDEMVEAKTPKYNSNVSLIVNDIFAQKHLFEEQMKPLISGTMDDSPPSFVLNGYNTVSGKSNIRFYVGWQVPPLYMFSAPLAFKFGSTGFILAHEIMHSFGTVIYDKHYENDFEIVIDPYNLKNDTLDQLRSNGDCIKNYYKEYCDNSEMNTEGNGTCYQSYWVSQNSDYCTYVNKTHEENVADTEGIKIAYRAYKAATLTIGNEPNLPNMFDYSMDQIFFIAFVRQLCTASFNKRYQWCAMSHSPKEYRATQPLMNFPEFAKAFKCPAGSRYKRQETCSVYS